MQAVLREIDDARAEDAARRLRMAALACRRISIRPGDAMADLTALAITRTANRWRCWTEGQAMARRTK